MSAGKVVTAVIGAILALVAIGLLIGGGGVLWAYSTQRDATGYFDSPTYQIASDGYAIVTSEVDLASHPGEWIPRRIEASVRLRVRAARGGPVFVGIAPTDQVTAYLSGVARDEVTSIRDRLDPVELTPHSGEAPSTSPDQQTFWVAASEGEGERTLTWELRRGEWSAVIMNADASAVVSVSVVAGAKLPILEPIGIGLVAGGLFLAALASLLLIAATRRGKAGSVPVPVDAPRGTYPVRLEGDFDASLSPALWLVKWFLAIPHFVVLAFLWAAFAVLTFFAWLAILFTGRYPKGIFEFNVGVLRWTWRVAYYSYAALGTDQYPPFSLRDVDYPARLSIAYPARLSPGLAWVKWWLLAIPHYVIVAVLTRGIYWSGDPASSQSGGGLIAVLVLIAAVALLFTGRYPRGLFDLIMGLNRWVVRVVGYVALMTDEYPPFRLDMGGSEPAPRVPDENRKSGVVA